MAGQKSGKAPGQTPYEPGGAEVWSDSGHDYFTDKYFGREASVSQGQQQRSDQDRLWKEKRQGFAEGGAVKPNYDRFASDPARWSKTGRMGFDPEADPPATIKGEDYPKKGSYTVPKMCGGGKVIKTWSK